MIIYSLALMICVSSDVRILGTLRTYFEQSVIQSRDGHLLGSETKSLQKYCLHGPAPDFGPYTSLISSEAIHPFLLHAVQCRF